MTMGTNLVVETLYSPAHIHALSLPAWDVLLRQARRADLSARVYWVLREHDLLGSVPEKPRVYLELAWQYAERQRSAVQWELNTLWRSLQNLGIRIILLKGAAYLTANLPSAHGRILSDIDLLVPRDAIDMVERALIQDGWIATHQNAYDQRYYRQWMHEIPPLEHAKRGTVVDIHHAILPVSARIQADMNKLRMAAIPLNIPGDFAVLAPIDMVLHSAAHLFYDSELGHGLRDLVDIDALLRYYGTEAAFWEDLLHRGSTVGLSRALYYALRYSQHILNTPIPATIMAQAEIFGPPAWIRSIMDQLYLRALIPHHPSCMTLPARIANFLLFIRGHWLRMPLRLLIPHLLRKAFVPHRQA